MTKATNTNALEMLSKIANVLGVPMSLIFPEEMPPKLSIEEQCTAARERVKAVIDFSTRRHLWLMAEDIKTRALLEKYHPNIFVQNPSSGGHGSGSNDIGLPFGSFGGAGCPQTFRGYDPAATTFHRTGRIVFDNRRQ